MRGSVALAMPNVSENFSLPKFLHWTKRILFKNFIQHAILCCVSTRSSLCFSLWRASCTMWSMFMKIPAQTNNCWSLKETCLKLNSIPSGQMSCQWCYMVQLLFQLSHLQFKLLLFQPQPHESCTLTSVLSNFNVNHWLLSLLPINHRTLVTSRYSGLCLRGKRIQIVGKSTELNQLSVKNKASGVGKLALQQNDRRDSGCGKLKH